MQYLYHRMPENMNGTVLHPLNKLRDLSSNVYAEAIKKYKGREFVMEQKVPTLDCLWNDVIHLSVVHPQKVENELKKYGKNLKAKKFFRINPNLLESENTIIYLFNQKDRKDKLLPENWTEYNPNDLEKYGKLTGKTSNYYKETIECGKSPLLWVFIPHILYRGSLDTSNFKIIEVK